MGLERLVVGPTRVDIGQSRIALGTIGLDRQATEPLARGADDLAQRRRNSTV